MYFTEPKFKKYQIKVFIQILPWWFFVPQVAMPRTVSFVLYFGSSSATASPTNFITPTLEPPLIIHDPVVVAAFIRPLLNACFTLYGKVNLFVV